jgi:hypothetical protein
VRVHVVRSADGSLVPEPGYVWAAGHDSVVWARGHQVPALPHVTTAEREGCWRADPGYAFLSKDSLAVKWIPGLTHTLQPDLVAGTTAGSWLPKAGFQWLTPADTTSLAVAWVPGVRHPTAPSVVSGTVRGTWLPIAGYRFLGDGKSDLRVTLITVSPSEAQVKAAVGKVVLALIANAGVAPQAEDGLLQMLGRETLRTVRDEAVASALRDLMPGRSQAFINASRNVITLAADGRLTGASWSQANLRDEVFRNLRSTNADAADIAQVADFIGRVMSAYRN